MSERKVLNKYYPPDFDPAKIPRRRRPKDEQYKVRLMAPFSMRCNTCGEWVYKGKKFNARKENAQGEMYLNIQVFRFYIRCPRCSAEITFKTDPKHADYICEHGASRNFEPWREEEEAAEENRREREAEEENNPMKHLENRTLDTKREIDILDALDEIRSIHAQHERTGVDAALQRQTKEAVDDASAEVEEDEKLIQSIFGRRAPANGDKDNQDDDEEEYEDEEEFVEELDLFALVRAPAPAPQSTALQPAAAATAATATAASLDSSNSSSASSQAAVSIDTTIKRKEIEPVKSEPPKKQKLTASALGIVVKKKT